MANEIVYKDIPMGNGSHFNFVKVSKPAARHISEMGREVIIVPSFELDKLDTDFFMAVYNMEEHDIPYITFTNGGLFDRFTEMFRKKWIPRISKHRYPAYIVYEFDFEDYKEETHYYTNGKGSKK